MIRRVVLAVAAIALLAPLAAHAAEVIHLTDETFEHHTQAGARPRKSCPSSNAAQPPPPLPPFVRPIVRPRPLPSPTVVSRSSSPPTRRLARAATGQTTGPWFVKFHAPWCGHCRALAPTWANVAEELDGAVAVADVDCTANPGTCDRFNKVVKGYPTLVLFRDEKMFKFPKGSKRDAETLAAFATASFASDGVGEPVPAPMSWFAVRFSKFTRALAMWMIDVHDTAEMYRKRLSKDCAAAAEAFRAGGVGGFVGSARKLAAKNPKLYGAVATFATFSCVGLIVCFVIVIGQAVRGVKAEKRDGEKDEEEKKND